MSALSAIKLACVVLIVAVWAAASWLHVTRYLAGRARIRRRLSEIRKG